MAESFIIDFDMLEKLGIHLTEAKKKALKAAAATAELAKSMSSLADSQFRQELVATGKDMLGLGDNASISGEKISVLAGKAMLLVAAAKGVKFDAFTRELVSMGNGASEATAQLDDLAETAKKMKMPNLARALDVVVVGQKMRNMENAFLQGAAAAGDFGKVMGGMGLGFADLDRKMFQISTQLKNVSNATGVSVDTSRKYFQELQEIPGALSQVITKTDGTGQRMSMLEATIKVTRGTFQDMKTVTQDLQQAFAQFGTQGQKSLQLITSMHDVAQRLNMPMKNIRNTTFEVAKGFKFLGDTTQSAVRVMAQMTPALRAAGLGPDAIQELTTTQMRNMSQMTMAQKSFLAEMSGMGGGMAGAFEIDMMIREDRLDEIRDKVKDVLQSEMGGVELVGLEQARMNEAAAMQMAQQIKLLTSGPLKMADTDQQAIAMIEGMIAEERGVTAEPKKPEDAFKEALSDSEKIADRQVSLLTTLHNDLQYIGELQALTAYKTTRKAVGTEGLQTFKDKIRRDMAKASDEAATQDVLAGKGAEGGETLEDVMGRGVGNVGAIFDKIKSVADNFRNGPKALQDKDKDREERKEKAPVIEEPSSRTTRDRRTPEVPATGERTITIDEAINLIRGATSRDMPETAIRQVIEGGPEAQGLAAAQPVMNMSDLLRIINENMEQKERQTAAGDTTTPVTQHEVQVICVNCNNKLLKITKDGAVQESAAAQREREGREAWMGV